jgi:hypothetical protein
VIRETTRVPDPLLKTLTSHRKIQKRMTHYTPEELDADLQNEQEFMDFFERKNIETIDQFLGRKQYNSLSDCFRIKQYDQMPRIGLVYYAKARCPDELADIIINKYKLLFEKWARFSVER